MASDSTVTLNKDNFKTEVINSAKLVLVDFWAPWCGPCKQIAPILEQLATEQATTLKVGKLDIDTCPELAAEFNIRSIPTLLFFKAGKVVQQVVGAQSKTALEKKIIEAAAA